MRGVAAIDVVADEVHSERIAQLGHFDAVDTKAGVVLGFAGAITALSTGPAAFLSEAGLLAAVIVMAERTSRALVWEGSLLEGRHAALAAAVASVGARNGARVNQEVETDKEPEEPTGVTAEPTEEPPPFQPDPELIAYLEHGGKPSEREVGEMREKAQGRTAAR